MKSAPHKVFARFSGFISVLVLSAVTASRVMAQCAMCSGAADASSGQFAYSKSTLFMLSVPYLLLGGVAGYIVHAYRQARGPSPGVETGPDPGER
jgi:hypothetical protein